MENLENWDVTISTEVLFQEINDETVLLDLKSEAYYGLDAVGSKIWQLLQADKGLDSVADVLVSDYDVSRETVLKDIEELLVALEEAGIVQIDK